MNGLEAEYGDQIDFLYLNAEDGNQGQAAFRVYALRGHPSFVLVAPDGEAAWIRQGVVTVEEVEMVFRSVLEDGSGR